MKVKGFINFLIIVSISLLFIGCNKVTDEVVNTNTKAQEDKIIVTTDSFVKTLDSSTSNTIRDNDLICALFDGLVGVTNDNDIIPVLANGWKISDDGLEYSFLITGDKYWSSGEVITVNDFLEFFSELFKPENKNYDSDELDSIYGIKEYKEGTKGFDEVGIFIRGESELVIRLLKEDPDFLLKLTKPEYRLRNLDNDLDNYQKTYKKIDYTGGYNISSVDENKIILVKNKNYINEFLSPEEVELIKDTDNIKNFAMYSTGKIDVVLNPPKSAFDEGTLIHNIDVGKSAIFDYLVFNTKSELGKYIDFRKAIYTNLSTALYNSSEVKSNLRTVAVGQITTENIKNNDIVIDTGVSVYTEATRLTNLDTARELLGYVPNYNNNILRVIYLESTKNDELIKFLTDELELLNIKIEFFGYDEVKLPEVIKSGSYDLLLGSIDLEEETLKKRYNILFENLGSEEFSIISLMRRNNYWCKSSNVDSLYVDSNGNLIFKKSTNKK